MELFERLFTKRKLESNYHDSGKRDRSSQITTEQVRLLLFKECDWRGRKLLFDSSTIEKVPAGKHDKPSVRQPDEAPCIVEVVDGYSYVYKGPAADTSRLGEMIFGEVAMNCKGVSLKIHIMNEPRRLLCTKVFCVPASRKISKAERKASDRNSSADLRRESNPLNVPAVKREGVPLSFSLDRADSGFYGEQPQSPYSSIGSTRDYFSMFGVWDGVTDSQEDFVFHSPPGRKLSTSSNGSWQRRTFQNLTTRFDLSQSSNLLSVPTASSNFTSSDSQVYSNSNSSASGTSDSLVSTGCGAVRQQTRKNKLGLALLITITDNCQMDLVKSCIEHSPQLQALVCRLRLATLAAGSGAGFVSTLYQAVIDAAKWLSDLVYGPRLPPIWLTLVTSEPRIASKTADTLLTDLCSVLSVADTKHTNFFMSTLLTHVLTYHLGWVTTVSPYDTLDPQKTTTSFDEPRRPYNALWAQLSDLCGAIGFPPRAARTVICGTSNLQLVNRLLVVLTYFVRSGDVRKTEFKYEDCVLKETKVVKVSQSETSRMKRTKTLNKLGDLKSTDNLKVPEVTALDSDSSVSTLVASDPSIKKSSTLVNLSQKLSNSGFAEDCSSNDKPMTSQLRRNPTMALSFKASSDSSLNSSEESEVEQKVVFVLGDNEKLVGLKNKSNGGKSVKKSSKVQTVPEITDPELNKENTKERCDDRTKRNPESPSRCCAQTLQHSKPIKHSGFKFEFDKYPQIVTNYMKSKNLEILDRHYIGKPGNLKLDNFQFDPTVVPPIQEERCEICYRCQQMESMLQTPTNASEMEYMNDIPRVSEPQYAKETLVRQSEEREVSPKTFTRRKADNTVVVNVKRSDAKEVKPSVEVTVEPSGVKGMDIDKLVRVSEIVQFPMPRLLAPRPPSAAGFDGSLLGGVTDHYVPDLILQGTMATPNAWEKDLRRDLDLTCYLNKSLDVPTQAVAIIGDTNTWDVRVVGRECGGAGGMSALVAAMLDPLPAMVLAKVPAHQCLSFLEGKLREFCVLSKTLADMLMSTDFCDIATLTKSLNIDVNDVPLLLAVATTHTPQVATRYGISYR